MPNTLPYSATLVGSHGTRHGSFAECLFWAARESRQPGFKPSILRIREEGGLVSSVSVGRNEDLTGLHIASLLATAKTQVAA